MRPWTRHGVTIPADVRVLMITGSAHRDERQFPDPDRFDIHRKLDRTRALRPGPPPLPREVAGAAGVPGGVRGDPRALPPLRGRRGQPRVGAQQQRQGLLGKSRCASRESVPQALELGRRPRRIASSTSPIAQVMPRIACVGLELPVDDQTLVGRDAPQHVEHRRGDRAFGLRPLCRSREPPRRAAPCADARVRAESVGSRGVRGSSGNEDTCSKIRAARSATSSSREPLEVDSRLLLEARHHRVAQLSLVGEMAVDRSLVHAGVFGDGRTVSARQSQTGKP